MQVTVELPDGFVSRLMPEGKDAARQLLEESVASGYSSDRLTMEEVRILLGFDTRMDVDVFLGQHEIYDYTLDDLDQDLAANQRVLAKIAESSVAE